MHVSLGMRAYLDRGLYRPLAFVYVYIISLGLTLSIRLTVRLNSLWRCVVGIERKRVCVKEGSCVVIMENNLTVTTEQLQQIVQAAVTAVNAQSTTNNAQPGNNDGGARPRLKAPERPEVDLGFSETQYAFFEDEWKL